MTKLRAIELTAGGDWDSIVGQCHGGLVFHLSAWLEVLTSTQESRLKRYSLVLPEAPRELIGVMPVFMKRYGLIRVAGSPLVVEDTPYMGPAVPEERTADAIIAVRDAVKREASFLRVLLPYAVSGSCRDRLEATGFAVIPKKTHRLDLTIGAEGIWKDMEGRCRTAIRRAEKEGVEVSRLTDIDDADIASYYALAEQVYGHQGRSTPNSFQFYQMLCERLGASGRLSLIMARVDGRDVAGGLFAHDQHDMYYLDGASDRDYRKVNAGNVVLWHALQWGAANGLRQFDFVGSDIPRLARFKASFGGVETEHSCVEWARSSTVWAARAWYADRGKLLLSKLRTWLRLPGSST